LGLETSSTVDRLNRFNAVQNTYLNTFQWLGGLGLLLGSVGLGLVVQRNVLERRGELALLAAVGFPKSQIQSMILSEHLRLLTRGMILGIAAALLATAPIWSANLRGLPWISLSWILGAVFLVGSLGVGVVRRGGEGGQFGLELGENGPAQRGFIHGEVRCQGVSPRVASRAFAGAYGCTTFVFCRALETYPRLLR
jgi:hypothetical protein